MKFNYKGNEYELMEMNEPYKNETFDIIGIFRVKYVVIKGDIKQGYKKVEVDKHDEYEFEDYEYINYVCNQGTPEENIDAAKYYIDDYLKANETKQAILTKALSIIKSHYMVDEEFFESDQKNEIAQNIKDLEKMLKGEIE